MTHLLVALAILFGVAVDDADIGTGQISDRVWLDLDGDGAQGSTEPGLPAVTVTLAFTGSGGTPITRSTVTGSDGTYTFAQLPAASFTITVDASSAGLTPTFDVDGVGTPGTAVVALADGAARTDVDFGFRGDATVGGRTWLEFDIDGDGVFDTGADVPLVDIVWQVTWSGSDVEFDTADDVSVFATLDTDGRYLVEHVPFGDYRVMQNALPLTLGGLAEAFDTDGEETVNVAVGSAVAEQPALQLDFSYVGTGSISGVVWADANSDGAFDGTEQPLVGVGTTVTWAGLDRAFGTDDDRDFRKVSDSNGGYTVPYLIQSFYRITLDPSTLPTGSVAGFDADGGQDRTTLVELGIDEAREDVWFGEHAGVVAPPTSVTSTRVTPTPTTTAVAAGRGEELSNTGAPGVMLWVWALLLVGAGAGLMRFGRPRTR